MDPTNNQPSCFIIAEVAQAHDGSLGMAHAFIDAVARTGADAIKFQTHIAEAESTPDEPWRIKFSLQDASRYAYWQRMEFSEAQWHGLKKHADEVGLKFLSSPFSFEAVDLLSRVGVHAWKIASGEVNNLPLFDRMAATGLPFMVSTGMSPLNEIDQAVTMVRNRALPVSVLQCTSMYPTPPEKIGLNLIPQFQQRYQCPIGLSDHSGSIYPGLAAATLGAELLEVHVCFSRDMFGPDVPASLTLEELAQLVQGVRMINTIQAHPIDKDEMAESLSEMRTLFNKSVVTRNALPNGTVLAEDHLTLKKPGTGIPANQFANVLGRRLNQDIPAGTFLQWTDLV